MTYANIMADIFDRGVSRGKLPLEEEREAIAAAKLGDEEATAKLLYAYAYTLRTGIQWYVRALPSVDQRAGLEDIRAEAVMGLIEAIHKFDPKKHDRLAALAPKAVEVAVASAAQAACGFTVPQRSLTRFFGILRRAEGNVYEATAMAPQYEMTRETFLSILSSVRTGSYDAFDSSSSEDASGDYLGTEEVSPLWGAAEAEVEDRVLVEAAFRAVDDLEGAVVRDYYGFTEYNTMSDAEIAQRRGLSRPKVQRVRASALGKMRDALGA